MEKQKTRIEFINLLQVIGPIFVILGHSLNGIDLKGSWYIFSKEWIYIFHMPFFFMISGFLLSHSGWMKERSYFQFIKKKFFRLIVPYIVWNLLFFVPKYMIQSILPDSITPSIGAILKMFFYPRQNIWGHTWFLVGLFILYCLTPVWKKATENKVYCYACIFIGVLLYIIPIGTEFLCFSDLHKDIVFFLIGCYLGTCQILRLKSLLMKMSPFLGVTATVCSVFAIFYVDETGLDWIPCLLIILFLWALCVILENKIPPLDSIAKRSFSIYIMHWPVMLCVRILFINLLHVNSVITVIAMIFCGYLVPNIVISLIQRIKVKSIVKACNILLGSGK